MKINTPTNTTRNTLVVKTNLRAGVRGRIGNSGDNNSGGVQTGG